MCGINGIAFASRSKKQIDAHVLCRMRDVIAHRGPDGDGIFIDGNVGIGHRRLSIVDPAHGQQPMTCGDGSCVIVYNGEVYNHAEHRPTLEKQGFEFHNHSDTETILNLYRAHGRDCVEYLRGMFAFAIWDKRKRELFIARDRLGVKPLYYVHTDDGSLYFGSEIKSLLEAGAVRPELNYSVLPDQFANHGTSGDETLFRGVKRLPPGHTMVWNDGRIYIREFWDVSFEPKSEEITDAEYVEEWRDMFRESVRLRLMSDVPLGMFLSGGIDSSAIAAMMAKLVDDPIKTFSVGFHERGSNELGYARMVANAFHTDHHEITLTPDEFFDVLPQLVWHEDEPIGFIASVPLYFVSRLAQQHVKVVLTGEGSDETLAGYGRYQKAITLLAYGERYESLTPTFVREAVRGGVATLPGSITRKLNRTFLTRDSDVENLFLDNFAVFPKSMQKDLFSAKTKENIIDRNPFSLQNELIKKTDAVDILDKLLYVDTKTYLHELLMKQDQMSMAASVESRVPFLDHKLVEFSARMPRDLKLREGTTKWVLREAMKGILPPTILDRPKMGFPVPVGDWFRGEFRSVIDNYVLGPRACERGIFNREFVRKLVDEHIAGVNHDERLWALVNFEIWQRRFLDGDSGK